MKSALRRSVLIGNFLNLLIGVHFVVVAIVSLIKLRWYHQITIVVRVRNSYTTTTSYLAFVVLILVGLLLVAIFIAHLINSTARIYISSSEDAIKPEADDAVNRESYGNQAAVNTSIISAQSKSQVFGWTLIHLVAAIGLVAIIAVWSLNSGELVRQTISTQLEQAYSKYQFTNRSNPYTIAIDGMQDINTCCGSFDYTDFPHQRVSGLSNGNYPGSCCGKNIFGNNARVICTPEEIVYVRQTASIPSILIISIARY